MGKVGHMSSESTDVRDKKTTSLPLWIAGGILAFALVSAAIFLFRPARNELALRGKRRTTGRFFQAIDAVEHGLQPPLNAFLEARLILIMRYLAAWMLTNPTLIVSQAN